MIRAVALGAALSALSALSVLLAAHPRAHAQAANEARARTLFEEASAAMAEGRVADARDAFRTSLALEPRPATAFNLAVTLRESGAFRDALETYDALLDGAYGDLDPGRRTEVERMIRAVQRQLAHLVLTVEGADDVLLRVDGRAVEAVSSGGRVEVAVDPGDHVISARARGAEPVDEQVALEEGETRTVPFVLETIPEGDEPDDESVFGSPWPWVIFGILAASRSRTRSPTTSSSAA
jgi:tetratricopeptide (TPR) repeat protein